MLSSKLLSLAPRGPTAAAVSAVRGISGEPAGPSMKTTVPGPKSKALMKDLDKVRFAFLSCLFLILAKQKKS